MKTSSIILIFALFFLTSCQSCQKPIEGIKAVNDLEEMNLRGQVKSLKTTKFDAVRNHKTGEFIKRKKERTDPINLYCTFNKDGNIIEKIKFDWDGSIKRKKTYTYNEKKREVIEKVYNPNGELQFKRIISYNDQGNKTRYLGYAKSDSDDEPYKESFKYDENGNIIKEIDYKNHGERMVLYSYGTNGNLIEKKIMRGDDLDMKKTFEYDGKGNLIESKQHEGRTVHASYVVHEFYNNDKVVERKIVKNGEFVGRYTYQYDDKGNRTAYKKFAPKGKLVRKEPVKYEYDEKGNWISKAPLYKGKYPKFLIVREIEYYN